MAYTKRYFVTQAFEKIGMAEYSFDLQPEQLQSMLRTLDGMMSMWDGIGIRVGYPIPNAPDQTSLTEEFNPPYNAVEAIYLNLAVRGAPDYGKTLSQDVKLAAKNGYDALIQSASLPVPMVYPNTLPSGAGNKPWRNYDSPFIQTPREPVLSGSDGFVDLGTLPANTTP